MQQPLVMAFPRCRLRSHPIQEEEHDSPSFGETVGFDLEDGTDHREGHARFRSWTRFSWETGVFNGSLSDDFSPIGSKSGAKGWVKCPRRVSVVRYGRRVRVPAGLSYELVGPAGIDT